MRFLTTPILLCILLACATGADRTPRQIFREGSGRPVVMLGGGVFGAAMFAPHARALSSQFEIIRVQTLNVQTAESGAAMPASYSVASEAAALRDALHAARIAGRIDIVGASYGALVALRFASDNPSLVRTMTLFEPPAFSILAGDDPDSREMRELLQGMTPRSIPDDAQFFRFQCLLGACPAAIPAANDPARPAWDLGRRSMRGLAATLNDREDADRLRALRIPALIMTGNRTVSFHRRVDDRLAQLLPNAQTAELNGGHSAPRIDADGFIRELRAFLLRH